MTDANKDNLPEESKMAQPSRKERIAEQDIAYMSSLSQAALEKPTVRSQMVVWVILLVVVWLIVWANYAELDKIVRGEGKVVPSSQIQIIQNLEGGIVEELFIHSGDKVKKGQILIKLDNTQFASSYGESELREAELTAKAQRLAAEAFDKPFIVSKEKISDPKIQDLYDREFHLYEARQKQLLTSDNILVEQIEQKKLDLQDAYSQQKQLTRSLNLLKKEVSFMKPLVKQGIASQVDLLKLEREENEALSKLKGVEFSIPRLKSAISEARSKRDDAKETFANDAHEQMNQALAEKEQLIKSKEALQDRVDRTDIKSPVNGTIKQMFVNTIGGVVQPGSDIVEIVPDDDSLVLETKILPADIGFIYPGLKAKVKFTAYDFAIYGGLDGSVERISADTITDEEGNSFYIARIKTDKNHLGTKENPLYLLPGMTSTVDIIVGKHTVLDYLLKPIIKAKDTALRES
ncbi:HlyD family type I secretion periplasmic adaptor subunit [Thiomicrorhabdus immobilis]|uniref:Membrane fusion protein (MFP) family protein n=1 Tax=Thiomicrorhabdus immobilis TaxID=2791037 RepID=A0ABN6CU44_9GAMM|nr:HlyD family type I secretion periplasmic adaptor subunit [Thiomicrorhabdus immobilis]BCN92466.1 HlyD family type I secretion periplasmic adaptor subunit [Thiomicrorhabdus immobilis]